MKLAQNFVAAFCLMLGTAASGWLIAADTGKEGQASSRGAVIDASKYADLQAAFDAVPESGGLVRLPPGEFPLHKPLVLSRSNTRIEGAGAATCLLNRNEEGKPALILQSKTAAPLWRVQLANFRICGDPAAIDNKSTQPKSGDGLFARNVNELYLHGLSIDHNGGHGIHLSGCYEDARIADSLVTYNGKRGIQLKGCHDIVVNANQLEENEDALCCADGYNLTMNGNNIDDHRRHGVIIENTYGSVLSGNMIEECNGSAIILDRDCYGITLSANVIADDFGGGIDLRDAWGTTVSANTFTITPVWAIRVGPESGRITIAGNNFSDSYIGGGKYKRDNRGNKATGIVLQGTTDIVVSGNIFSGLTGPAVQADEKCRRLAVTGNVLNDLNRAAPGRRPGLDLPAKDAPIVEHNVLEEANSAGGSPPQP